MVDKTEEGDGTELLSWGGGAMEVSSGGVEQATSRRMRQRANNEDFIYNLPTLEKR